MAHRQVEDLLRTLAPRVLGIVARKYRDFDSAEDAVQEALMSAAKQWPIEGVPRNPRGWLYHVAVRRLVDRVRSEVARERREGAAAAELWAEWAFVPPPTGDVEVDRPEDAYRIAAKASSAPGKGGVPLNMAIEVRQVMSAPPVEA